MARRIYILLILLFGIACADALSNQGRDNNESTERSWSYNVTPSPRAVKTVHDSVFSTLTSIESLTVNNPTIQILMQKAKYRAPKLEARLLQWTDYVHPLVMIEKQLQQYVDTADSLGSDILVNYAEWCVSHDSGAIRGLLEKIFNLVVPMFKDQGLFDMLYSFTTKYEEEDVCDLQLSAHQLILDMYNTIALTEIRGYAMMQYSWMLLSIYGRGNFTHQLSLARQRYVERTGQMATAVRAALSMAKRVLYRCDPSSYNSKTYAEVTRLLQGYIENEVDMSEGGSCKQTCEYYSMAENHGCYMDQFCAKQPKCGGRIIDCQFIESNMEVCPASHNSFRRYEFIKFDSREFGKPSYCSIGMTQVQSWSRFPLWHCSYCMCLCDDATYNSHRYFSLRPSVSDIAHNKVVTGLRLVKIGRMFHLQIHQGTLLERGFVESSEEVRVVAFDPSHAGMADGRDYHKLTYEKRAIDLDELEAPSGSVLTGVRFQMIGDHLHFEIRSTPFDYLTGKLWPKQSQWITNDNTKGSSSLRSRLPLYEPDLPTRGTKSLRIDSRHDQYIEFTHTDFDADAAQSTVPFIDIQPVLPSKASNSKGATLNSGAGLYHRGAYGSGGFIGAKLITYDYSKHVSAQPPPDDLFTKEEDRFTTEIDDEEE